MTKEATEDFIEIIKFTSNVWGNKAVDKIIDEIDSNLNSISNNSVFNKYLVVGILDYL